MSGLSPIDRPPQRSKLTPFEQPASDRPVRRARQRRALFGYVPAPAGRPVPSVRVRPRGTGQRPNRIPQRRPGTCPHRRNAGRSHTGRAPLGRANAPGAGLPLAAAPPPASGLDTSTHGRARAGAGTSPSIRPTTVGLRQQLAWSDRAVTAPRRALRWGIPPAGLSSLPDPQQHREECGDPSARSRPPDRPTCPRSRKPPSSSIASSEPSLPKDSTLNPNHPPGTIDPPVSPGMHHEDHPLLMTLQRPVGRALRRPPARRVHKKPDPARNLEPLLTSS
jgi:hypothetical protein